MYLCERDIEGMGSRGRWNYDSAFTFKTFRENDSRG